EPSQDNSIMLRLKEHLDRLAAKLNVAKLSDFHDYSELEAQYSDFGEDDDEGDGADMPDDGEARGKWFDCGPALAAVRALHEHLVRHPEALDFKPSASRAHWPAQLLEELKYCQTVLEQAVAQGRQFRFLIVP